MHGAPNVNFIYDVPQHVDQRRNAFAQAVEDAQANMLKSLAMSGAGSPVGSHAHNAALAPSAPGPLVWSQMPQDAPGRHLPAIQGYNPWRGSQDACGCEGNISSLLPRNAAGVPLSTFDFMAPPFGGPFGFNPALGHGAPPMGGMGHGNMGHGGMGHGGMGHGGMHHGDMHHGGMGDVQGGGFAGLPHGTAPGSTGGPLAGLRQAAAHAPCGHDPAEASHGHAGHSYVSLDGIDMVHAKDEIRAGEFLTDDTFFNRLANGEYGEFSGVSLDMDAQGNLDGQVYISGHPAAFHQLYDEGREKGLSGEKLNQFIAEELTNINDLDDIEDKYYDYWERLGVNRPVKDHDLHNIGAIAITLAPGQTASLTGAHTYDSLTDPKYNFTDVKNDARGTFIEFYRLSNNNNSGNGHHEDLAAAARIYLTPAEISRLAAGAKPIEIVNERFEVSDDSDDYRISPAAVRMLAAMQMPLY